MPLPSHLRTDLPLPRLDAWTQSMVLLLRQLWECTDDTFIIVVDIVSLPSALDSSQKADDRSRVDGKKPQVVRDEGSMSVK
jgi:hypothetical protein